MLKNIVFIFISVAFMVACDSASQGNTAVSPFEKGKIFLAEADKVRAEGDDLAAKKIYKKAVAEFENAVREGSNEKGLARMLGKSLYRLRDFDNAIIWLNKAIAQDENDFETKQYLGYSYLNKTEIEVAQNNFIQAMSLDPSGTAKQDIIVELTALGELNLAIGESFTSQGNPTQGYEYQKLGMRIFAMALDFSGYDMTMAKKIQVHANEMKDPILIGWIDNIIAKGGKNVITIKQ